MRELEDAEVGFGEDCEDAVADVENNADLYAAANQESTDLINEEQRTWRKLRYASWVTMYFTISISRLVLTKRR